MKQFWIEGVLETSVHNAILLSVDKQLRVELVEHPWERVLEIPNKPSQILPVNKPIHEIFNEVGRSLLILGEPGSGKTISLLELAKELSINNDPIEPIPAIFNLSSWVDKHMPIYNWLKDELKTKYYIPGKVGGTWLKQNRLYLLLDGLDEVRPDNQLACVTAINKFIEEYGVPGLVVCSRIYEYTTLPTRLKLSGAICLQPLTFAQINHYLSATGKNLEYLQSILKVDNELKMLAQSPLMLSIMCLAYENFSIDSLPNDAFYIKGSSHKNLFNLYINRMFERKGKQSKQYTKEQMVYWLSWLAQNMKKHSQVVFLVERMQPSWFLNKWEQNLYLLISRLCLGLCFWFFFPVISFTYFFIDPSLENKGTQGRIMLWIGATLGFTIIFGVTGGLSAGIIDIFRFQHNFRKKNNSILKFSSFTNFCLFVISSSIIYTFIMSCFFELVRFDNKNLTRQLFGIIFSLPYGLIVELRGRKRNLSDDIQAVETFKWTWPQARTGISNGITLGIGLGYIIWVYFSITNNNTILVFSIRGIILLLVVNILLIIVFLVIGVVVSLPMGIIIGIIKGISVGILELKTSPNQGIKLSSRNSILSGIVSAIIISILLGILLVLAKVPYSITVPASLMASSLAGTLTSLWFGGFDVLQHYILRFVLYVRKFTPLNYISFLDNAITLIFLQKVGGGYMFIHRLLLEHFADFYEEHKNKIN